MKLWWLLKERDLSLFYIKHADDFFVGVVGMLVIYVIGLFCFMIYKMPLVK